MAKKQKNNPIKGLVATAEVVLSSEIGNVELQEVEVRATLEKTGRADKEDYRGYMLLFKDLNKVIPVNAGDILRIQEAGKDGLFEVTGEGHMLTHFQFGFVNGKLIAE